MGDRFDLIASVSTGSILAGAAAAAIPVSELLRLFEEGSPGILKIYLVCAARVILSEQGKITAYDGDRIMAVYTGRKTAERAVRTSFKINYVVQEIINPAVGELKPNSRYVMKQSIGVDTSKLLVTRTGPRSANDLVWIGRAANYAAKLSSREAPATHVTEAVYAQLPQELKVGNDGQQMWTRTTAREIGNRTVYSSTWHWIL